MNDNADVKILSSAQVSNYTKKEFTTIREGFNPNPNIGTETHEFLFENEPWNIISTNNAALMEIKTLKFTVSKVFNPNNTTSSFFIISWIPTYFYKPRTSSTPDITITIKDTNSGILFTKNLGALGRMCGAQQTQSKREIVDPNLFDRISSCVFVLGTSIWDPC